MHVCLHVMQVSSCILVVLVVFAKNPENLYWLVVSFVGSRYMCVLSLFSFKLWHVSRLEL